MPLRFLLPASTSIEHGETLTIGREQAHYITRVLRKNVGDELSCFDGKGLAFTATLTHIDGHGAGATVTNIAPRQKPPEPGLHLALSLLKGAAMDRAIQQAVELSASEISLVTTKRTEVRLRDGRRADNKLRHWEKIVTAACEQSGALHVPTLNPPRDLEDVLNNAAGNAVLFDASGEPLPQHLPAQARTLFVGPEGGWEQSELTAFRSAGVSVYRLGNRVLRAESMPSVALALIHQAQGWPD